MSEWRLILQWSDLNSNGVCHQFSNLTVVEPVHIAIISDTGLAGKASSFHQALSANIRSLSSTFATTPAISLCGGPRVLHCMGRDEPTCRSILVVICSAQRISPDVEATMNEWVATGPRTRIVLPVLPVNADVNTVLPGPLSRIVVLRDSSGLPSLVPDILLAAGVGSDQFRLFISYRQSDAEKLADQLYKRFSQEGFDVFLDRFRGKPGLAFPSQLSEALVDKGLVIAIESPNVWRSQWTVAEVLFAVNFRIGLLSIKIPGGASFSVIPSSDRFEIPSGDWNNALNPDRISESGLERFVQFVRRQYANQLLRRRVYLESLLGCALASQSLISYREKNGIHSIAHADGYSVELATRPPRLENIRRVADARNSSLKSAVVVGPRGFLDPFARSNVDWLLDKVKVASREETEMMNLAQSIRNGIQLT